VEEEVQQAVQLMVLAEHLKLVTVAEGVAGSPALEVEEAHCLLLEVGEPVGKSMEEVMELPYLARLEFLAVVVVEQHLRGGQHAHKTKAYLGMECCVLEVVVGLAHVRELEEVREPFAQ